jgi:L-threonylcarbamoyladenylate synthase
MKIVSDFNTATNFLKKGEVGIIPTDTIYGISCLSSLKEKVESIYEIKGREFSKPFIILISDIDDLIKFNISPTDNETNIIKKYWPGPVSIILDVPQNELAYLHRGNNSLAFRLPNDSGLLSILEKTGPLVSTSANISNNPPIKNSGEAKIHFDNKLDFMLDIGLLPERNPSRIVEIRNGIENIIR